MKIRSGFVSNSSSSSFCMVGAYIIKEDLISKFGVTNKKILEMFEDDGMFEWDCNGLEVFPCEDDWYENEAEFVIGWHISSNKTRKGIDKCFDKFKEVYGEEGELMYGQVIDGICHVEWL